MNSQSRLFYKESLPVFGPGAAPASVLKRLLLPQGEIAQFYDDAEAIHYVAFIELKAGTARGNHFHKQKREWIYLISGELRLKTEHVETHEKDSAVLRAGDLARIEPGIAHALEVSQSGHGIEFSPSRFDPADTYRFALQD
ncbi:MAG TPA: cupin domain-containing protein [Verrucomicrobiae bacterium]|nr:cupin domain-containing protein [Verrucomicrobiae bacterium]